MVAIATVFHSIHYVLSSTWIYNILYSCIISTLVDIFQKLFFMDVLLQPMVTAGGHKTRVIWTAEQIINVFGDLEVYQLPAT